MKNLKTKPIDILLVEDNEGDILLTQSAFQEAKIANTIHVAKDGEKALAFLNQEGEYADVPRPDIILLDINLPKIDGTQVLEKLKKPTYIISTEKNKIVAKEIIFKLDDIQGVYRTETMISLEESINDKKRLMHSIFNEL